MLPLDTRHDLLAALPDAYQIPVSLPDSTASGIIIRPEIRWQYQDIPEPDPPYDQIALELAPTGVIEAARAVDQVIEVVEFADETGGADSDADIAVVRGRRVYDVLNIRVTAAGSATIGGRSFSADERANGLARQLVRFLLNRFQSRPVDLFADDGSLLTDDARLYAEEFTPPLNVAPVTGRGPTPVTDMVDANGVQWDAAVRLSYFDAWVNWFYHATDAEINATFQLHS